MTQDEPKSAKPMERLSPDQLMVGFTRSPIVASMIVAALFHAVVIGASYGLTLVFVDDDTEQVATETDAETVADIPEDDGQDDTADGQQNPDDGADTSATGNQTRKPRELDAQGNPIPDSVRNSKMYQDTTSIPEPGEIPEEPDLGIGIEDTNIGG